jgi:membrane protease YdiL (CAAX protease family)
VKRSRLFPRRLEALLFLEIILLFALAHLGFRAFRQFTLLGEAEVERGWVISPGICFGVAALIGLRGARLSLQDLGLTRDRFLPDLGYALRAPFYAVKYLVIEFRGAFYPLIGRLLLLVGLAWILNSPLTDDASSIESWNIAGLIALAAFSSCFLGSSLPRKGLSRSRRVTVAGVLLLLGVWFAVIPFPRALTELIWLVGFSALGEELFFRGYVQSRCNQMYGCTWGWGETKFGPGVFVAAALFGLVHVLNPWNYFTGTGSLALNAGAWSALSLYLGFSFERTGGLIAPVALHAIGNSLVRIAGELSG